jgi:hypothetical protein
MRLDSLCTIVSSTPYEKPSRQNFRLIKPAETPLRELRGVIPWAIRNWHRLDIVEEAIEVSVDGIGVSVGRSRDLRTYM